MTSADVALPSATRRSSPRAGGRQSDSEDPQHTTTTSNVTSATAASLWNTSACDVVLLYCEVSVRGIRFVKGWPRALASGDEVSSRPSPDSGIPRRTAHAVSRRLYRIEIRELTTWAGRNPGRGLLALDGRELSAAPRPLFSSRSHAGEQNGGS